MRTTPFGSIVEPYTAADDYFAEQPVRCSHCERVIPEGDTAWYINQDYYCLDCQDAAMEALFEMLEQEYQTEIDH